MTDFYSEMSSSMPNYKRLTVWFSAVPISPRGFVIQGSGADRSAAKDLDWCLPGSGVVYSIYFISLIS